MSEKIVESCGVVRPLRLRHLVLAASLVAVATVVACEHAEGPEAEGVDVEALALRDVLGFKPALHRELSAGHRDALRERLMETGAQEEGWIDRWTDAGSLAQPAAGEAPFDLMPTDPLNAIRRLDGWRQAQEQDAWLFGVFIQGTDGAQTFGCPIQREDLKAQRDAAPVQGWSLVESFGHADARELAQLRSLAPGLDGWWRRCLEAYDIPDEELRELRVVRQAQAPFLLSFWPQRRSLYVHPLLLELWGDPETPEPPTEELRTREQAHHSEPTFTFESCVAAYNNLCALCTTEYTASHPDECQPIFRSSPLDQDCQALRFSISDGVARYCAHHFLERPSYLDCFQTQASAEICQLPPFDVTVPDVQTLGQYYGGFADPSTRQLCRTALDTCTRPADGDADGIPDDQDMCDSTPAGAAVDTNPQSFRYGCEANECLDGVTCTAPEPTVYDPEADATCETDCWGAVLNDSGFNDCAGSICGFDLVWYDYERPDLRDTLCEDTQPTHCCGEGPMIPENPPPQ